MQRLPRPPQSSAATQSPGEAASANVPPHLGAGGFGININQAGGQLNQDVHQIINQLIGGLGEFGQNATFNTSTNVHKWIFL